MENLEELLAAFASKNKMRGLAQAPSELGTLYFAWPDDEAPSLEIRGIDTLSSKKGDTENE